MKAHEAYYRSMMRKAALRYRRDKEPAALGRAKMWRDRANKMHKLAQTMADYQHHWDTMLERIFPA